MSSQLNGSKTERRNASTVHIESLATEEMLALINEQNKDVTHAITVCLAEITRLVDTACAVAHAGGRIVLAGAGASGRAAKQTERDFAADTQHPLVGLCAGDARLDATCGAAALASLHPGAQDMLLLLSVSGRTPWSVGLVQQARALGMRTALITRVPHSEAAEYAEIVVAAESGAEVVSGYEEPKARLAQQQILTMLTTALAVRSGRVFGNLRVDIPAQTLYWMERQIAIVMAATQCSRAEAKAALAACNHQCREAILMLLTGVDARQAADLLVENHQHLRLALPQARPLTKAC